MTGLHAEAADALALEVLRLLVVVFVLDERDALGTVGDRAAEDDEVVTLADIGARGDGTEGENVSRAVRKRRHGLREAARNGLRLDVEAFFLVEALLDGDDDACDLRVLAEQDEVQVLGLGFDGVIELLRVGAFACGAACQRSEACDCTGGEGGASGDPEELPTGNISHDDPFSQLSSTH